MLTFLVAIDGSGYSDSAVDYVVRRAGLSRESVHVHLLNVQLPLGGVNVKLFIKPESVESYHREEGMATLAAPREALKAAGKTYELHMYEGANHAFNNDTNAARYNKEAADLAWSRTLAFFRKHLV